MSRYTISEIEIETNGIMAIITGEISFTTLNPNEQKESEIRVTDIWF